MPCKELRRSGKVKFIDSVLSKERGAAAVTIDLQLSRSLLPLTSQQAAQPNTSHRTYVFYYTNATSRCKNKKLDDEVREAVVQHSASEE